MFSNNLMAVCPDDRAPPSTQGEGPSRESDEMEPASVRRVVMSSPESSPPIAPRVDIGQSPSRGSERHVREHAGVGTGSDFRAPSGGGLQTDRYSEIGVIGHGGSGVVIRALDKDILRDVAIKIVDPSLATDGSEIGRFTEEARITGQLEHPSIVPIYELGVDERGRRFLCMKLIEGATLEETLNQLGESRLTPVQLSQLLQVFLKVCDAVSFAHSRGVLHRDLKPTNIMVSDFGQVYVLDWGIARLRRGIPRVGPPVRVSAGLAETVELDAPGSLVGTTCYMAPEQLQGKHDLLDERTDVFALGATLYQILTGQPPLTADIARAFWMRRDPPPISAPETLAPPAAVPPGLSRIAMRALSYEPSERYASVASLKEDLEAFQRGAWDVPRVTLAAGSIIIREGEGGDAAYVILEGRCVAYQIEGGAEVELRVMGPGEVFGETAVFSRKPRSASVKAATDVVLLMVTGEILLKTLGVNSWMGAFVKALADRFREADQKLRDLGRASETSGGGARGLGSKA
jgi:eukaryotic-like serine/threonine-protein kinase